MKTLGKLFKLADINQPILGGDLLYELPNVYMPFFYDIVAISSEPEEHLKCAAHTFFGKWQTKTGKDVQFTGACMFLRLIFTAQTSEEDYSTYRKLKKLVDYRNLDKERPETCNDYRRLGPLDSSTKEFVCGLCAGTGTAVEDWESGGKRHPEGVAAMRTLQQVVEDPYGKQAKALVHVAVGILEGGTAPALSMPVMQVVQPAPGEQQGAQGGVDAGELKALAEQLDQLLKLTGETKKTLQESQEELAKAQAAEKAQPQAENEAQLNTQELLAQVENDLYGLDDLYD